MWAADGGVKWSGLVVNAQYFMRWQSDFDADGPLPLVSTLDRGAELSAAFLSIRRRSYTAGMTGWVPMLQTILAF
jgi:hypothetical protein